MSDEYILKYTNGYANFGKIDKGELIVEGDCKITNHRPIKQEDGSLFYDGKDIGEITIDFSSSEQKILEGTGKGYKKTNEANFSKKKFSIFSEIAALDGNKQELSVNDIYKMNKSLIEKWGLKDLRLDFKNGVATLIWGENDILRIEFVTKNEKLQKDTATKNTQRADTISVKSEKEHEDVIKVPETYKIKSGDTLSGIADKFGISVATILELNRGLKADNIKEGQVIRLSQDVEKIISEFIGGNIDIDKVHDLASVAKYTGISEDYILDVLVSLEGNKKWPLCVADYDGVGDETHPKGYLTIGFGHTSLASELKVTEGMKITEQQAYQILADDIINAKNLAVNKLKNKDVSFNEMPHSIQCAVIDIIFNKGPSGINNSLVEDLKKEDYGAAARRTWYKTEIVGLQKRNMYRFISAIEDLNKKTKKAAVKNFRNEHFNHLQAVFKKDNDAKIAWNDMCKSISYSEASF